MFECHVSFDRVLIVMYWKRYPIIQVAAQQKIILIKLVLEILNGVVVLA